jgi:hypothetical protein
VRCAVGRVARADGPVRPVWRLANPFAREGFGFPCHANVATQVCFVISAVD